MMSRKNPRLVYHRLAIIASSPTTEIRLGADAGHLSWSIMKRIFVPQSRRVVVCIEKAHHMKTEQKHVAAGAASGVVTMAVSVWILAKILPTPVIEDALAERLAYVLRANVVALVPFFIMLITVGNSRFLSEAIDPTRRAESRSMEIDGRVADNTCSRILCLPLRRLRWGRLFRFIICKSCGHVQLFSCSLESFSGWVIGSIRSIAHQGWRRLHT